MKTTVILILTALFLTSCRDNSHEIDHRPQHQLDPKHPEPTPSPESGSMTGFYNQG